MPMIKLQSSDGDLFDIDVEVAKCSGTIKMMLEHCGIDGECDEGAVVPLPNVNSPTLKRIVEWFNYHKGDALAMDANLDDKDQGSIVYNISPWDANFLTVELSTLYELTLAANYLDIKGLLNITCLTIAEKIKGKSAAEIKTTFNIKNDFVPAEGAEEE